MEVGQVIQRDVLGKRFSISERIQVGMSVIYLGIEKRQFYVEQRVSEMKENSGLMSSQGGFQILNI